MIILYLVFSFFFFKQKTAYEMRISDWSSDVCSSDLMQDRIELPGTAPGRYGAAGFDGSQRLYHVLQIKTLRPVHGAGIADGGNRLPILHRAGIECIGRNAALFKLNKGQVIARRIGDDLAAIA